VHDLDGPDADHFDDRAALVSEVDAEDEVAEAEARAEAARARLVRLRRAAETGGADDGAVAQEVERHPAKPTRKRLRWLRRPGRPRWLRRPGRKTVAVGVGIVLFFASLGASGDMVWQHRAITHKQKLAAEFSAAARQAVTALMSIDPDHAKEDVQRMIDASTGDQKNTLSVLSTLIVKKAEDTKVGSKVTVEGVAVESLSDNSGVVLVAAKTDPTGPDNAKPPPALFRLAVNMDRDGGQLKMSKVDFLS
jgi:Mce-associated membrane protein